MTLKEAAHFFDIPQKLLLHFQKKGFLHDPLEEQELSNLSFMRYVWKDKLAMKLAMARWSKKERLKFVEQIELTKPEAYALNRYINAKAKRKVYLRQVAEELCHYYKIPLAFALKIAKRMRWKFYRKNHQSRSGKSVRRGSITP